MANELPVTVAIPEISESLARFGTAVLVAPPGTGKTTAVPPALLHEDWLAGQRIVMLEPRRMAARAAAARMASVAGQRVGEEFGFSVRHDSAVSKKTRVEVVTEGLFANRLQADPELSGIGLVILDEFHERSLQADTALAFLLEIRETIREDLRILVMSATLNAPRVAKFIADERTQEPGAQGIIEVEAPIFDVETNYRPPIGQTRAEDQIAEVVVEAMNSYPGDVLVFLPGRGEIGRVHRKLQSRSAGPSPFRLEELHGSVNPKDQDRILNGAGETRRVILATSIAETSVTIPGVRIVVDSGRRRTQTVHPRTGLPSLTTTAVSLAGADQRRGRAGRTAPGACYRLWAQSDERHRVSHDPPEILSADLAQLTLQTRLWGTPDPTDLRWLDEPPPHAVQRAETLLEDLSALGADGRLTERGQKIAQLGFHPRLGAVAAAAHLGGGSSLLAAEVCAVLDSAGKGDIEIPERVRELQKGQLGAEAKRSLKQWKRSIGTNSNGAEHMSDDDLDAQIAELVFAGFADRLARRRDSSKKPVYQLRHGGELELPRGSAAMAQHRWILAVDLDAGTGTGRPGRLYLGVSISNGAVMNLIGDQLAESTVLDSDDAGAIRATRVSRIDAITVDTRPWHDPPSSEVAAAVVDAVQRNGPQWLPRWQDSASLRTRVAFLQAHGYDGLPDLSDQHLADTAESWLLPQLHSIRISQSLKRIDVPSALWTLVDWSTRKLMDDEAPKAWGADDQSFPLAYGAVDGDPGSVMMAVKLQRLLGVDQHPEVGARHIPITVELLSPARRPVQRTQDLPGFWRGSYAQVRAEMRSRYRKHDWPEKPWLTG